MNQYIEELNNKNENNHDFFENLREYANSNNVPIIKRESLMVMNALIKAINANSLLEVGTAIGYSSLSFVNAKNDLYVDTIERNIQMYEQAIKNIKYLNFENNINVIFSDALELDVNKLKKYDVIFIDAAKAQYQKFFDKYSPLLNDEGIIISDNILFHGCVADKTNLTKNVLNMVKKIDAFNHYLSTLENFETIYLDIGDGLAVTMRKKS